MLYQRSRYQPIRTELPPQRKRCMEYIYHIAEKEDRFPSQAEICDYMGWVNVASVRDCLSHLVGDGRLVRKHDKRTKRVVFAIRMDRYGNLIDDAR